MSFKLTSEGEGWRQRINERVDQSKTYHQVYRDQWASHYRQFRSFKRWQRSATSSPADVYPSPWANRDLVGDAQREWGADLAIPYTFSVVETIVPRMVSALPQPLVLPRSKDDEEHVEPVRLLIEAQTQQINYDMTLMDTAKSGEIFGLGVQKIRWCKYERERAGVSRSMYPREGKLWVDSVRKDVFDDPEIEDVDIFDFLWDPYSDSIKTCQWVVHRTWRPTEYLLDMLGLGDGDAMWKPLTEKAVEIRDVEGSGSEESWTQVWQDRMEALGHVNFDQRGSQLHEVWEYHNGRDVVTVVDRELVVNVAQNTMTYGRLPFVAYRPATSGTKQLPGIGSVEPLKDLQQELDALRGNRLDNATWVLHQSYAYRQGTVDPRNLRKGPGWAIPVRGDPNEVLRPLTVGDIPGSGYRESEEIKEDMDRASGVADPVSGGDSGANQTATGVQLVTAAANERIKARGRRLASECVKPAWEMVLALDQAHITETQPRRAYEAPQAGQPERRYTWFEVGPAQLQGQFDVDIEGGQVSQENTAQDRSDAQMASQMFQQNPNVDQRKLTIYQLRKMGVDHPEGWVVEPGMDVDARAVMAVLTEQYNLQPEVAQQVVQRAAELQQQGDQQQGQDGAQNGGPPGAAPQSAGTPS